MFSFAKKQPVGYTTLVYIILSLIGQNEVIMKYVNLIDDEEERNFLVNKLNAQ